MQQESPGTTASSATALLLAERQHTHGDFNNNALISQKLKAVIEQHAVDHEGMHYIFRESLDMICLKLSRICSGQAHYKDHWDDIAGYAALAAKACIAEGDGGSSIAARSPTTIHPPTFFPVPDDCAVPAPAEGPLDGGHPE